MKKFKSLFGLVFAICILLMSGCNPAVSENIEKIEIEVHGYEKGAAEITVHKGGSLTLNAVITWQERTNNVRKLEVIWEFIDDDLGCEISIIDPCCTDGTLARVKGNETGKIILRATAKSKNEISADLIIWIEQDNSFI